HEEEDVTAFVTELLSHGQAGQRHTETVAGRFVHLTEHHGHLGLFELVELNNTGFCHFVIEVVPFTGTLTHTSENGQTAVRLGDVVDELKHVNRLAHAGAAEQADLTALRERADQVNNLNAGFEQFNGRRQLVECRCVLVNGTSFGGFDGTALVDGAAQDVHNAAQSGNTNGYRNRRAGVDNCHATTQAVGRTHGDGDRKSTRLNSSHVKISYAVFCLKKKNTSENRRHA